MGKLLKILCRRRDTTSSGEKHQLCAHGPVLLLLHGAGIVGREHVLKVEFGGA